MNMVDTGSLILRITNERVQIDNYIYRVISHSWDVKL